MGKILAAENLFVLTKRFSAALGGRPRQPPPIQAKIVMPDAAGARPRLPRRAPGPGYRAGAAISPPTSLTSMLDTSMISSSRRRTSNSMNSSSTTI